MHSSIYSIEGIGIPFKRIELTLQSEENRIQNQFFEFAVTGREYFLPSER